MHGATSPNFTAFYIRRDVTEVEHCHRGCFPVLRGVVLGQVSQLLCKSLLALAAAAVVLQAEDLLEPLLALVPGQLATVAQEAPHLCGRGLHGQARNFRSVLFTACLTCIEGMHSMQLSVSKLISSDCICKVC